MTELKEAVKELFEKYLNVIEESDNGRLFHPTTISTCRAMKVEPLNNLLEKLRVLSGAEPDKLEEERKRQYDNT